MNHRWRDTPGLLRSPVGRLQLVEGAWFVGWPVLSRAAALHRRTLARGTWLATVVGSLGKSTTTRALCAALDLPPPPLRNAWGRLAFAALRIRRGQRHSVLEVGIAAPGQMAAYARMLRPDAVVVTSIASEHNRSLGSLEATRAEKARMLEVLAPDGVAILNGDDPNVLWMRGRTRARVVSFGVGANHDVGATAVELDWPHGTRFTLHAAGARRALRVRLVGRPMLHALLAATATALAAGRALDEIVPALEGLAPTPGRLEPQPLANGVILLRDEFKSTLESIDAALDLLAELPARRRFVVLGEVSEPPASPGAHYRRLGARLARIADRVVVVGSRKAFQSYASGARAAGTRDGLLVSAHHDLARAAELVRREARCGDVVLIKGRDRQHLERISLRLAGVAVTCGLSSCASKRRCAECPLCERSGSGAEPAAEARRAAAAVAESLP